MADYTPTSWVENVTKTGPTNLNKMEAGIQDAAQHHKTGTLAALPAASAANKNWLYFVTDYGWTLLSDGSQWICIGNAPKRILASNANPLPTTNLVEGVEVILSAKDLTVGAPVTTYDWRLRYNASDGYWYAQGQTPLEKILGTSVGSTNSGTYVSSGTGGTLPKLTLPALQGDFDVEVFSQQAFVDTTSQYGFLGYSPDNGTTAPDDNYSMVVRAESANNGARSHIFGRRRTITPAAGGWPVLQMMMKVSNAANFYANGNGATPVGIRARPVRVKNS